MNKSLKYLFIISLFVFTLFSAGQLYGLINTVKGEFFYLTLDKTGGGTGILLLVTLFSISFIMGVIALLRTIKQTKLPMRLYCDLCAILAFSWTAHQFVKELVFTRYYFLNPDLSNLTNGLIGVTFLYGFIFLSLTQSQKHTTN